jgi:hypothetical protein
MPDNEMQIILSLVDKASEQLKKVKEEIGGIKKPLDEVKKGSDDANKSMQNETEKSSEKFRTMRREIMLVAAVVLGIVAATREYAKYNSEARKSINEFDLALQQMSVSAGQALLPVLKEVTREVKILASAAAGWAMLIGLIDNIATGKGAVLPDKENISDTIIARQNLKDIADAQKEINDLFLAGTITTEEYYSRTLHGQTADIDLRQKEISQVVDITSMKRFLADEELSNEINYMAALQQKLSQEVEISRMEFDIRNSSIMLARTDNAEKIALLKEYEMNFQIAHRGMASTVTMLSQSIRTNLSTAFTSMITGAKSASEAFKQLGLAMVNTIVQFMVEKVIAWVLEKTLLAGTVAANTAAAAELATAWYPAAVFASLATAGGNAVGASAGIVSTAAVAKAVTLSGGNAGNFPGGNSVQKVVSVGMSASSGGETLYSEGMAEGGSGVVSRPTLFLAGERGAERFSFTPLGKEGARGGGDIYIEVNYPQMGNSSDVQSLSEQLGFEIERKLRNARSAT